MTLGQVVGEHHRQQWLAGGVFGSCYKCRIFRRKLTDRECDILDNFRIANTIEDDNLYAGIRHDGFLEGLTMGYMSAETLVEELKFKGDHAVQYFFGTPRAVELLKRIEI